jgi:pimeloyl-ACP methyl ester carboxylesterase
MDAKVDSQPRPRSFALPDRGGAMAALEFGPQARPVDVVFSHANGFNACTYRSILAPLAASLRILAVDLRGHGASTLPADPAAFSGWGVFAADLGALLDQVAEAPVVLAGHSLGATASLLCAAATPKHVRALVLFEPVMMEPPRLRKVSDGAAMAAVTQRRRASFPDRAAALAAYRGRGAFKTWDEAQLADYVAAGLRETADGQMALACTPEWESAIYARQDYDALAALRAAPRPARILAAPEGASSVGLGARDVAAETGVRLDSTPATSHFLPMERPDLVREALAEAAG